MSAGLHWVVFALGGNEGDPLSALQTAATRLSTVLQSPRVSGVYRTQPEGGAEQPSYLNAALAGRALLSPRDALDLAQKLEAEAGRERPYPGAPRCLDVDVLFVGDAIVDEPGMRIPHPRWATRDFVVIPLLDVVPDLRDPESGRTVREVATDAGWGEGDLEQEMVAGGLLAGEAS